MDALVFVKKSQLLISLSFSSLFVILLAMPGSGDNLFVISYRDPEDGKVVSLNAETIRDSSLGLSFIAISDFVFEKSLVANPTQEKLKRRFENTKTLHISIYSVVSIEEVGRTHKGLKFKNDKSNLVVLSGQSGPSKEFT